MFVGDILHHNSIYILVGEGGEGRGGRGREGGRGSEEEGEGGQVRED